MGQKDKDTERQEDREAESLNTLLLFFLLPQYPVKCHMLSWLRKEWHACASFIPTDNAHHPIKLNKMCLFCEHKAEQ